MFREKIVYSLMVLLFNYEFLSLGAGASVFKVFMLPLAIVGLIQLSNVPIVKAKSFQFIVITCILFIWSLLGALNEGQLFEGIINKIGILLIIIYFCKFFYKYQNDNIQKLTLNLLLTFFIPYALYYFLIYSGGRFSGIHKDPNFAGCYISLSLMSALYFLLPSSGFKNTVFMKALYLAIISICLYLIVLTGSRGVFLTTLILVLGTIFIHVNRFYKFLIVVSALYIVQLIMIKLSTIEWKPNMSAIDNLLWRLSVVENLNEFSRLKLFQNFISISDEIIFYGMGSSEFVSRFGLHPHNLILDIYIEVGLLVGTIFVLFVILRVVKSFKISKKNRKFHPYCLIAIVGLLVFLPLSAYNIKLFWLFIVLLIHSYDGSEKRLSTY